MNTELLLQVKDAILAQPEHFDMMSWFVPGSPLHGIESLGECGTTACIAGWAVHLHGAERAQGLAICDIAEIALDLTESQANRLFYTEQWPYEYRRRYRQSRLLKTRVKIAAERIIAFIESNGER